MYCLVYQGTKYVHAIPKPDFMPKNTLVYKHIKLLVPEVGHGGKVYISHSEELNVGENRFDLIEYGGRCGVDQVK